MMHRAASSRSRRAGPPTGTGLLLALGLFLIGAGEVRGIPAFARKYRTSCATCHVAYPRLNATGRAFLYSGYQFPGGRDADADRTAEEPVRLGADANRRIFPDAIWPNAIPALSVLALVVEAEVPYLPDGDPKLSFEDLPARANLYAGGNFQDDISFFAQLIVEEEGVGLEVAHVGFDHLLGAWGPSIRVGRFHPIVLPASPARRLTAGYWIATRPLGDNAWNLERPQRGIEARALLAGGRAIGSVGIVEGAGNEPNGEKDFYVHGGYKVGGLRLDGTGAARSEGGGRAWEDDSVRLAAFFYRGHATLAAGRDDPFIQAGASADVYRGRLNVMAAAAYQADDRPVAGLDADGTGLHLLAEATVLLYPWLLPGLRYERFREEIMGAARTERRLIPGLIALVRANVKFTAFVDIVDDGGGFEVDEVRFALSYGL
jgi:hypothetical protein